MNVFFKINDTLYTAPTSERILDGVTRKSIIELAKSEGIKVEERSVLVNELVTAAKDGSLTEIFGAGTAAVVSPIVGFQYKEHYYELPKQENATALIIKDKLTKLQYKLAEDKFGWTVKI
jgi:branched-chain amino acid aminotransferase